MVMKARPLQYHPRRRLMRKKGPTGLSAITAQKPSRGHTYSHTPYIRYCDSCVQAKMSRRPARRQHHDPDDLPKAFGEFANADHIIAHLAESEGLTGERDALGVVDSYSDYKDCFP